MKATFDTIEPYLIGHEGGFANRSKKADPGGPTKYGITIATLAAWRGGRVTIDDVRNLTRDEARRIYKAQYWDAVRGDRLPAGLDYAVFDFGVNSGPGKAIRVLQDLLRVKADGVIGLITLDALTAKDIPALIESYSARRLAYMKTLKNWRFNKTGWPRRVAEVQALALDLYRGRGAPEIANAVPRPKPAGEKALCSETSALSAWTTPEGAAQGVAALSGVASALSGSGPLQWAFAASLVLAVGVAAYLLVKRERAR